MSYDIGDQPRLAVAFRAANTLVDPTTVSLRILAPDNIETTYTYAAAQVQKSSTGMYFYDLLLTQSGNWYYTWIGAGGINTTEPGEFYVRVRRA